MHCRMVTGDVHTWLWCDVPYHRGWWRALSTSIHDCNAVLRGTYVYHMENLLMTLTVTGDKQDYTKDRKTSPNTHTQTHHTHTLWHFHIYIEDSSNREDIIAIAICSECLICGQCYCYQFHYSLRFLHDLRSRKVVIQLTSSHQCLTLHLHLQPRWPGSIGGRPERAH